jgi:two-component system catabolic regulation response regulator CreB
MSEKTILIVEDEQAIADSIAFALGKEGFAPHHVMLGEQALAAARELAPALVILDVGLPDISGLDVCRRLRQFSEVPVIFLTARSDEIDRIVGLEIGGDDYLVKPFSPRELTARIKVILRRVAPASPAASSDSRPATATPSPAHAASSASAGPFVHDELRCRIAYRGHPLDLTRIEYRLLKTFLGQPGRVFNREQLLSSAWDEPEASLDRTVDAHVKTLRAKLRAVAPDDSDPIVTHRGLGYSLRE